MNKINITLSDSNNTHNLDCSKLPHNLPKSIDKIKNSLNQITISTKGGEKVRRLLLISQKIVLKKKQKVSSRKVKSRMKKSSRSRSRSNRGHKNQSRATDIPECELVEAKQIRIPKRKLIVK